MGADALRRVETIRHGCRSWLLLVALVTTPVIADEPTQYTGLLDFNGYVDTRDFSVLTINALANLPGRVQYFSLTNYFGASSGADLRDLESFYSEQNLRWAPYEKLPLDLTIQWVIRSPQTNDQLRGGVRWRVSHTSRLKSLFEAIHAFYSVNVHLLQVDFVTTTGWRGQIEHVYKIRLFPTLMDRRLYLSGFLDHNLALGAPTGTAPSRVVTEHQLGLRVVGGFHVVSEFRYNQFFATKRRGVGIGIQYVVPFILNRMAADGR